MTSYLKPLEQSFAMQIILEVHRYRGLSRREILEDFPDDVRRTVYMRINHLEKIGILEARTPEGADPLRTPPGIHLTSRGERIAEHVRALDGLMQDLHDSMAEDGEGE